MKDNEKDNEKENGKNNEEDVGEDNEEGNELDDKNNSFSIYRFVDRRSILSPIMRWVTRQKKTDCRAMIYRHWDV